MYEFGVVHFVCSDKLFVHDGITKQILRKSKPLENFKKKAWCAAYSQHPPFAPMPFLRTPTFVGEPFILSISFL